MQLACFVLYVEVKKAIITTVATGMLGVYLTAWNWWRNLGYYMNILFTSMVA